MYSDFQLLKHEVGITFHFRLCSTHCTVVKAKKSMRSASAINSVTVEITTEHMP